MSENEEPRDESVDEPAPPEQPPAEPAAPEEGAPASDESPATEEPAPATEEPAAAPETDEEAPGEPTGAADRDGGESKPAAAPGAELDPITLEPERELSAEERARLEAEEEERARLEAEAAAEEEPAVRPKASVEIPAEARIQATGKRKSSIARVIVSAGEGRFEVNDRDLDQYFPREYLRSLARQPLVTAGYESSVDVRVRVQGGGVSGQAGAVRHGLARALTEVDPDLRGDLKRRGLLTRDARRKERRKAGLKKARKRPQFSKR